MSFAKQKVEELFWLHSGRLRALFKRRSPLTVDVQDLVQEVYLRILRVPNAASIRDPEAYLLTVARNLVREQAVLKRKHELTFSSIDIGDLDEPAELPTANELADRERNQAKLREVLQQLSPKCQAVVVLRYRENLSYQDIAARLQISDNMVKKYLCQAIAHCRKRMTRWS